MQWESFLAIIIILFLQIYNEMIRDLLNPSLGFLELREDAKGNVQVAGISEVTTRSTDEVNMQHKWILNALKGKKKEGGKKKGKTNPCKNG